MNTIDQRAIERALQTRDDDALARAVKQAASHYESYDDIEEVLLDSPRARPQFNGRVLVGKAEVSDQYGRARVRLRGRVVG